MRPTTSTAGILRPDEAARYIGLRRYAPPADLARYVERYWAVHWDLRDRGSYCVELIPHPCINLTVIPGVGAQAHGVGTHKSLHPLVGTGYVFGVKFRPGGFRAFSGSPAAPLTDRSTPLRDLFGPAADEFADSVAATTTDDARVAEFDAFLRPRMPTTVDPTYELALRIVATMLDDRTITRVAQVAERYAMSARTLQRLFNRYVGVGPKWVIRRYRLHDGAERLAEDPDVDPAALAVELGWFDQAHFTRDFTTVIGVPPLEYAAACAATPDREPTALLSRAAS